MMELAATTAMSSGVWSPSPSSCVQPVIMRRRKVFRKVVGGIGSVI